MAGRLAACRASDDGGRGFGQCCRGRGRGGRLGAEAAAETVAGAGVEGTLRVVVASSVEVAARADGESSGAVAVCAILALPVI